MDSGISEMINGVLSNPDALNKIMTLMPAVAQMMNGGGSNNSSNLNNSKQEKIVETTVVNNPDAPANPGISTENLMSNEKVISAFKNLITALNDASSDNSTNKNANEPEKPNDNDAVMASAFQNNQNNINADNIANIASMLGSAIKSQPQTGNNQNQEDNTSGTIEKTLDTLKNFSSVTSPESDHRSKLLLALKPFLKDGRKTKIDTAIKYMNAAKIINLFGKNGFV